MRNYLTVLFRNFRRERLYTAINLAGLSLGVACCLVLGLFLKSELTYDQHFKGNEHIYRVEATILRIDRRIIDILQEFFGSTDSHSLVWYSAKSGFL